MSTNRKSYAILSSMDIDWALDADCWTAYAFDSTATRDAWVAANEYDGQNYVARTGTRHEAYKIAGLPAAHKHAAFAACEGGASKIIAAWD